MTHATMHTTPASRAERFSPRQQARTGPLLVAVGGSDSDSVLRTAHSVARTLGTEVVALSAIQAVPAYTFPGEAAMLPPGFEQEREATQLARLQSRVHETLGDDVHWKTRVSYGDPARVVSEIARDVNPPLVVMGIGRHRPLDRLLGTETAVRAIRLCNTPVLAVTHNAKAPMNIAVVATDFSVRSARAAESALMLLAPDATIHLAHVWERIALMDEHTITSDDEYERSLPDRLERFSSALGIPKEMTVHHVAREGRPAEEILRLAEHVGADLVVAGRHGRGLLTTMLVGSVTTSLLRGSQRSILVTPEPTFADMERLSRLLTGNSTGIEPSQWRVQLDAFTRRNMGRTTVVEIDDPALGAQVLERGYALLGATYDTHDRRVALMLGVPHGGATHVTRQIGDVQQVSIATAANGEDVGLSVRCATGQTLVTFV